MYKIYLMVGNNQRCNYFPFHWRQNLASFYIYIFACFAFVVILFYFLAINMYIMFHGNNNQQSTTAIENEIYINGYKLYR